MVNGQKVWTTLAHLSRWGMLIVRTDPEAAKHRGMTYFVVDMHAPGVDVRPLRQMTGEAEFNEVFFTDVRIPDAERLGEVGDGWHVAITTLMNERVSIGGGIPPREGGVHPRGPDHLARPAEATEAEATERAVQRDELIEAVDPGRGAAPHQHPGLAAALDGHARPRGVGRQEPRRRAQQGAS